MKKWLILGSVALLAGCADMSLLVKEAKQPVAAEVFQMKDVAPIASSGKAVLSLFGSIKRPLDGNGSGALVVNVDGQPQEITPISQPENVDPRYVFDAEKGEGRRDSYRKDFLIASGKHRLVVALPDEGVAVEKELVLGDQQYSALVLEPKYRSTTRRPYAVEDFKRGIQDLRLYLNGSRL